MSLTVSMVEGTQYHMGKLDILAKKELSAWLRTQWELTEGSPYDASYIDTYIEANRDKLPADFTRGSVQVVRNCPDASVAVTLLIDPEGESKVHSQPHDVPCEEKDKPK